MTNEEAKEFLSKLKKGENLKVSIVKELNENGFLETRQIIALENGLALCPLGYGFTKKAEKLLND